MPPNDRTNNEKETIEIGADQTPKKRKIKVMEIKTDEMDNRNSNSNRNEEDTIYNANHHRIDNYDDDGEDIFVMQRSNFLPNRGLTRSASVENLDGRFDFNAAYGYNALPKKRHVSVDNRPKTPVSRKISEVGINRPIKPIKKVSTSKKNGNMVIELVLPTNRKFDLDHIQPIRFMEEDYYDYNNNNSETNQRNRLRRTYTSPSLYSETTDNQNFYYYEGDDDVFNENTDQNKSQRNSGQEEGVAKKPITSNSTTIRQNSLEKEVKQEAENIDNNDHEQSTPPEERNKAGREFLTKILSSVYALFIVTCGFVVYISDIFDDNSSRAEIFSIYLIAISFCFLCYLSYDIRRYKQRKSHYMDALGKMHREDGVKFEESSAGELHVSISVKGAEHLHKPLEHHYCLSKGRHSGSFYLKIGAAGFCLGHLVHSGLIVGYQIVFLTSDEASFHNCASISNLVLDIIHPVYSFLLLYFIFKYSNVIINRFVPLARIGLMHCIASSICFWIWTIIRETLDSLDKSGIDIDVIDELPGEEEDNSKENDYFKSFKWLITRRNNQTYLSDPLGLYSIPVARLFSGNCESDKGLTLIYKNYSPYLYPFTVEYSILVVGVLFIIWQYIGTCKNNFCDEAEMEKSQPTEKDTTKSHYILTADFHMANRGLFGGILVIVLSIVGIILFFISVNDTRFLKLGIIVNMLTNILLLFFMAICGILAYFKIKNLDINNHPISLLDDILIFICIPAFFISTIFSIIPAVHYDKPFDIAFVLIEVIQMLIQTPLIIDGLRRCSNTKELRKKKPGRELVTFLIVCNLALWLTQTFEIKSHAYDIRYDYYGKLLWTIIGHMTLPLIMFYRFHSSVCLVDVWKHAYEPASH